MRETIALVIALLVGCSADHDHPSTGDAQTVLDDPSLESDFDFAEQLYTESDRQWFCSVTMGTTMLEDEVYFNRNGQAQFTRFGDVFWNRSLDSQTITIASPTIDSFSIGDINSANTVLSFNRVAVDGAFELYDCVLVGRENPAPVSFN